ncbi:hypothetical protein SHVI106290_09540 [Shewanella violacea]|uniref:Uncharacterized protein n=1 Tax=Shewanella violacea (strain JCM 10179 / CIP 106290 / LMG 19151 / DSS12) TaxID=637905 RepID=D4ZJ05_SHEVD|nr:hypothetical protein SVI_1683 [Shewanella violacea DSS12]
MSASEDAGLKSLAVAIELTGIILGVLVIGYWVSWL